SSKPQRRNRITRRAVIFARDRGLRCQRYRESNWLHESPPGASARALFEALESIPRKKADRNTARGRRKSRFPRRAARGENRDDRPCPADLWVHRNPGSRTVLQTSKLSESLECQHCSQRDF